MNIRWLKDFIALADYQKFTVAAQVTSSSQAAFSRRIQQLEKHFQTELFDRQRNPIKLTAAGKQLYPTAIELIKMAESCEDSLRNEISPVVIGSLHTLSCNFFPSWFANIHRQISPPILTKIDSSIRSTSSYFNALRSGRADFIIFYNTKEYKAFFSEDEYHTFHLAFDKLIWVCSKSFAQSQLDLAYIPYLSYSKSAQLADLCQPLIERTPTAQRLQVIFKSSISEALIPMVIEQIGVACVPESAARYDIENGRLIQIWPEYTEELEVVLIAPKKSVKVNSEAERLLSFIKSRTHRTLTPDGLTRG
jgi:DNA-binding transcriptional LysR family regulator